MYTFLMEYLFKYLETLYHVEPRLKEYLAHILKTKRYLKERFLLKQGTVCNMVWFLSEGLTRWFSDRDDKGITTWFVPAGEAVMEPASFYDQLPSLVSIVAVEDCETIYAEYKDIMDLYERFPDTLFMGRKIADKHAKDMSAHSYALLQSHAEERYAYLLKHHGYLIGRVPVNYLASFINMDLSTFYRAKNEWMHKQLR